MRSYMFYFQRIYTLVSDIKLEKVESHFEEFYFI